MEQQEVQQNDHNDDIESNQQLLYEKIEIIDKIERTSNLNESKQQSKDNFETISKENEDDLEKQQDTSLNKDIIPNNNEHLIEDLNEEQSLEKIHNDNNNKHYKQSSSLKDNKFTKEDNNTNQNPISKLDTLIKSNETFREVYELLNNNYAVNLKKTNNNEILTNPKKKNRKNPSPILFNLNSNLIKYNETDSQNRLKKPFTFQDTKSKEDNIFDLYPHKIKEKFPKQKQISKTKGKLTNLYDEIHKFAEKKYNSKSLGPYPKKTNAKKENNNITLNNKLQVRPDQNNNKPSQSNYFKTQKNITIDDDSFYFPQNNNKQSKQKINHKPINKNIVSGKPSSLFTSVDKWVENQSIPETFFYKEKEKTIQNLLTSIHGYSFRNDNSTTIKNSYLPLSTQNVKYNSYNTDFYNNKLNSFTLRLYKPLNTIDGKQRDDVNKREKHLFNKQKVNNSNDIISPFYKTRRINLCKPKLEKYNQRKLL
jgi:hypothetical protein